MRSLTFFPDEVPSLESCAQILSLQCRGWSFSTQSCEPLAGARCYSAEVSRLRARTCKHIIPEHLTTLKSLRFWIEKKKKQQSSKKKTTAVRPFSTWQEPEMFFFWRGFSFVFFCFYIHPQLLVTVYLDLVGQFVSVPFPKASPIGRWMSLVKPR